MKCPQCMTLAGKTQEVSGMKAWRCPRCSLKFCITNPSYIQLHMIYTPEQAKEWIEHSPQDPGKIAEGLAGWLVGGFNYCARCVGRLGARGLFLDSTALPVWRDSINKVVPCQCCGEQIK